MEEICLRCTEMEPNKFDKSYLQAVFQEFISRVGLTRSHIGFAYCYCKN